MAITNETKYVTVRRLNRFKEKLDAEVSASLSDYAQKSELGGKEDKMAIVAVSSGTTALNAELNKYYRFDSNVGTLGITLPSVSGVTELKGIVFSFTTGSTPAVTFTSTGGVSIDYQTDYTINASIQYEINAIYNGSKWIIAYATIG